MENLLELNSKKLLTNRLLKNDEEIIAFEEAMHFIAERENIDDIQLLCQAFDDDTEEYEVMFGLIHTLESYDKVFSPEMATTVFVKAIPAMLGKADEWLEVLLLRILNDDNSRIVFAQILGGAEKATRGRVLKLLKKIANEEPDELREKVDHVVQNL